MTITRYDFDWSVYVDLKSSLFGFSLRIFGGLVWAWYYLYNYPCQKWVVFSLFFYWCVGFGFWFTGDGDFLRVGFLIEGERGGGLVGDGFFCLMFFVEMWGLLGEEKREEVCAGWAFWVWNEGWGWAVRWFWVGVWLGLVCRWVDMGELV